MRLKILICALAMSGFVLSAHALVPEADAVDSAAPSSGQAETQSGRVLLAGPWSCC